jgi:hypothetical protein
MYYITRSYKPENHNIFSHHHKNLKFHVLFALFLKTGYKILSTFAQVVTIFSNTQSLIWGHYTGESPFSYDLYVVNFYS